MKLTNLSKLPTDEVRTILRFAKGRINLDGVLVAVRSETLPHRQASTGHGRYYPPGVGQERRRGPGVNVGGSLVMNEGGYITVYVPRIEGELLAGAHWGVPEQVCHGWQEGLLVTAAHEFYHHRQWLRWRAKDPTRRGRRPSMGQAAAERYCRRRLAAWRERQVPDQHQGAESGT